MLYSYLTLAGLLFVMRNKDAGRMLFAEREDLKASFTHALLMLYSCFTHAFLMDVRYARARALHSCVTHALLMRYAFAHALLMRYARARALREHVRIA
jgi:hypothetical protein